MPGLKKEAEDHVQLQGEVKWRQEHTPFSESVPTYLQPSLVSFRTHGPYYLFFTTFSLRVWFPAKRLYALHFRHVPHRASARIFPSYVTRMQGFTMHAPAHEVSLPTRKGATAPLTFPTEKQDRFHLSGEGAEYRLGESTCSRPLSLLFVLLYCTPALGHAGRPRA